MGEVVLGSWDWLLVSVVVAILASLVRWTVAHMARSGPSFWHTLDRVMASPWCVHSMRLLYAVGLPAVALFRDNVLSAKALGLKPLPSGILGSLPAELGRPDLADWARDLGWMMGIAAVTWLIVTLGDRAARPWTNGTPSKPSDSLPVALREAVAHQTHWAFYRAPFVAGWGPAMGSWLGALPVALEALVSPMFWETLRSAGPAHVRRVLIRMGLFVAGVELYLKTQNLWMVLAFDALVGWLLLHRSSLPASPMSPESAAPQP